MSSSGVEFLVTIEVPYGPVTFDSEGSVEVSTTSLALDHCSGGTTRDVTPTELIQRPIRHQTGVETHRAKLIAPRPRSLGLLEGAHRLPPVQTRIADGHQRLFGGTGP